MPGKPAFSWKFLGTRCERKTQYETKLEARAQAAQFNRKNRGTGVVAYRCQYCSAFHIGTRKGS